MNKKIHILAIFGGYLFLQIGIQAGSTLFTSHENIVLWNMTNGLLFAFLILFGWRYAWVGLLSSIIALYLTQNSLPVSASLQTGQEVLFYTLAAEILRKYNNQHKNIDNTTRSMLRFVLISVCASLAVSLTSSSLSGAVINKNETTWLISFVFTWMSELIGLLTLTPFIILVLTPTAKRLWALIPIKDKGNAFKVWLASYKSGQYLLIIIQTALFSFVLWLIFGFDPTRNLHTWYLCYLPLLWLVVDYGAKGASLGGLILVLGTSIFTYIKPDQTTILVEFQQFLLIMLITTLVLGSLVGERSTALQHIATQRSFYETILGQVMTGVIVVDPNDHIRYANRYMETVLGLKKGAVESLSLMTGNDNEILQLFRPYYRQARQTLKPTNYDSIPITSSAGQRIFQTGWLIPLEQAGTYDGMIITVQDITNQVETHNRLVASEERFHAFMNHNPATTFIKDEDGHMVYANPAYEKFYEWEPMGWFGKTDFEIWDDIETVQNLRKNDDYVLSQWEAITTEETTHIHGKSYDWLAYKFPFRDSVGNRLLGGVAIDMTEYNRLARQLRSALDEKEALLREIHHRVKNNFSVIISLLNLQSNYLSDDQAIEVLKGLQDRIQAMSLVHEGLYQAQDLAHIDFGDYVRHMVENLESALTLDRSIRYHINIENLHLGIEYAIPCGLIINELVTNAYKHAFREHKQGEISIFAQEKEGEIILQVKDNGCGIPPDFDFESLQSFGLRLVRILARQLRANVDISALDGTSVSLCFFKRNDEL